MQFAAGDSQQYVVGTPGTPNTASTRDDFDDVDEVSNMSCSFESSLDDSHQGLVLADISRLTRLQLQVDVLNKEEYKYALKQLEQNHDLKKLEILRSEVGPHVIGKSRRRSINELIELQKVVTSRPCLEELYLYNIGRQDDAVDVFCEMIKGLPNLQKVHVFLSDGTIPSKIQKALTTPPKLSVLVLHVKESVDVSTILSGCKKLKEFYISSSRRFQYSTSHMRSIIRALSRAKDLQVLDLGRPSLSVSSMTSLALAIEQRTIRPTLKSLSFTYNPDIAFDLSNSVLDESIPTCDIVVDTLLQALYWKNTQETTKIEVNSKLVEQFCRALQNNSSLEVLRNHSSRKVLVNKAKADAMIDAIRMDWKIRKFEFFRESPLVAEKKMEAIRHKVVPYSTWKQFIEIPNNEGAIPVVDYSCAATQYTDTKTVTPEIEMIYDHHNIKQTQSLLSSTLLRRTTSNRSSRSSGGNLQDDTIKDVVRNVKVVPRWGVDCEKEDRNKNKEEEEGKEEADGYSSTNNTNVVLLVEEYDVIREDEEYGSRIIPEYEVTCSSRAALKGIRAEI